MAPKKDKLKFTRKPVADTEAPSLEEVAANAGNIDHEAIEECLKIFKRYDTDGSGGLDKGELILFLRQLLPTFTEEDIQTLFESIDVSGDSIISAEEFVHWMFGMSKEMKERCLSLHAHVIPGLCGSLWQAAVDVPEEYTSRHSTIAETHRRGLTLDQLRQLGKLVKKVLKVLGGVQDPNPARTHETILWVTVNLYHICDLFVIPLTKVYSCSFVELVSTGAQDPLWFCSHWWGTPFKDTLEMIDLHASIRVDSEENACYWICTFANNQHDLSELSVEDVMETPFAKCIMSDHCVGTLSLLTMTTAMPFTRIWCILEDYVTIEHGVRKKTRQLLDVATIIPGGTQEIVEGVFNPRVACLATDDGMGRLEDAGSNCADEATANSTWFPASVAKLGAQVDITKAFASNPSDKANILRLIGERASDVSRAMQEKFAGFYMTIVASIEGNLDETKRLLDSGLVNLETIDRLGVLSFTASYETPCTQSIIRYLVQARANVNAYHEGSPAVHWAISSATFGAMKALLEAKCDVNAKGKVPGDEIEVTPVERAVNMGWGRAIKLLMTQGAEVPDGVNVEGFNDDIDSEEDVDEEAEEEAALDEKDEIRVDES